MSFLADPGGIFASDVHRRVLASISTPEAEVGWTIPALLARLNEDPFTPIPTQPDLDIAAEETAISTVLKELKTDGFVEEFAGGIFRMSVAGFEALTGPIANQPGPSVEITGPADLGSMHTPAKATAIGNVGSAVSPEPSLETPAP